MTSASKKVRWCARGRWATPPRGCRSPLRLRPPPPSSKTPPSRCDRPPPSPRRTGRNASGSSEEEAKNNDEKKGKSKCKLGNCGRGKSCQRRRFERTHVERSQKSLGRFVVGGGGGLRGRTEWEELRRYKQKRRRRRKEPKDGFTSSRGRMRVRTPAFLLQQRRGLLGSQV